MAYKGSLRGANAPLFYSFPLPLGRRVKERRSLSYILVSPSPLKERGIKGVR